MALVGKLCEPVENVSVSNAATGAIVGMAVAVGMGIGVGVGVGVIVGRADGEGLGVAEGEGAGLGDGEAAGVPVNASSPLGQVAALNLSSPLKPPVRKAPLAPPAEASKNWTKSRLSGNGTSL